MDFVKLVSFPYMNVPQRLVELFYYTVHSHVKK